MYLSKYLPFKVHFKASSERAFELAPLPSADFKKQRRFGDATQQRAPVEMSSDSKELAALEVAIAADPAACASLAAVVAALKQAASQTQAFSKYCRSPASISLSMTPLRGRIISPSVISPST